MLHGSKTAGLWSARRRKVGMGLVWMRRDLPIPRTTLAASTLCVCTLDDDIDCEEYTSTIWALTPEGRGYAERIATDLATFGYAWSWPHEAGHVCVYIAGMHRLVEIAGADEPSGGEGH